MKNIDIVFSRLKNSDFRNKFKLKGKELEYLQSRGIDEILNHARDFINSRLTPSDIPNDGKQTPYRNHPVFVAQHATATCCRGCLEKWHGIKRTQKLSDIEVEYIIKVIGKWLNTQTDKS